MELLQDLPYEEIEHLLDAEHDPAHPFSDEQLAVAIRVALFPHLAEEPIFKDPELWKAVDSKWYNMYLEQAKRFAQYLIKHAKAQR